MTQILNAVPGNSMDESGTTHKYSVSTVRDCGVDSSASHFIFTMEPHLHMRHILAFACCLVLATNHMVVSMAGTVRCSNACEIPADTPVPGESKLKMHLKGTKLTIQINGGAVPIPDYSENDHTRPWTSEPCMETIHELEIGQGVAGIGAYAFAGLHQLTKLTIPEHMAGKIGDSAFAGCTKLATVEAGNSFTSVGKKAFFGCSALTSIQLIAVTTIGDSAFEGCKELTTTSLNEIATIGARAFFGCEKITTISVREKGTIGESAFESCASLTTFQGDPVTSIGKRAFFGCAKLQTVSLNGITAVPDSAFEGCVALSQLTIKPAKEYGARAFYGCKEVSDIPLTDATKIGEAALAGTGISFSEIPAAESIKAVPESLFEGCARLRTVMFAEGSKVTEIGAKAFSASALDSIEIPATVTKIGDDCFKNCESLNSVTYKGTTEIANSIFEGCMKLKKNEIHLEAGYDSIIFGGLSVCAISGKEGELEYTIQRGSDTLVLEGAAIPDYEEGKPKPWAKCLQFVTVVEIGEKVTSIGAFSFEKLTTLKTLNLPDGLQKIGPNAFRDCVALESISKVPSTITEVGDRAFSGCKALSGFTLPNGVKKVGSFAFDGCSVASSLNIPTTVEEVGEGVFRGCASLTQVEIPSGITKVPKSLFDGCSKLEKVTFASPSDKIKAIEDRAFAGCSSLTSITLPSTVLTIGEYAFENTGLKSIAVPETTTVIGAGSFRGCTALTDFNVPSGITTITQSLFEGCSHLKTVSFLTEKAATMLLEGEKGIKTIEARAFYGCSELQSITLPITLVTIGVSAFEQTGLISIIIPEHVERIGKHCFKDCKSLKEVEYKGTTKIKEDIFPGSNPKITVPDQYPSKDFGGDTVTTGGQKERLSDGAIAGIVIAVLAVVTVIIVIAVLAAKGKFSRKNKSSSEA